MYWVFTIKNRTVRAYPDFLVVSYGKKHLALCILPSLPVTPTELPLSGLLVSSLPPSACGTLGLVSSSVSD